MFRDLELTILKKIPCSLDDSIGPAKFSFNRLPKARGKEACVGGNGAVKSFGRDLLLVCLQSGPLNLLF